MCNTHRETGKNDSLNLDINRNHHDELLHAWIFSTYMYHHSRMNIIYMLNLFISIRMPFPKREYRNWTFLSQNIFVLFLLLFANMVYKYAKSLIPVVCRAIHNIKHTKRCEQTKLEPVYVKQNTFSVQMVRAFFLSLFLSFFCLTKPYSLQNIPYNQRSNLLVIRKALNRSLANA